jgi:hypothetical protein
MRRTLIGTAVALLIVISALAAVFVFSEFRSRSQRPLHEAFSDFVFVLDTGMRQVFGFPFPALDESAYRAAMGHARRGAHRFVDDGIVLRLERWGAPVLPSLARELERADAAAAARDYARIYTAVNGIGEIGGPAAARILADWLSEEDQLARLADPSMGGGLLARVVSALGRVRDPLATELLIEIERRGYSARAGGLVLDAIGRSRTPNAAAFLLERYAAARNEAEIDALIWPLAFTHDPRAGAVLAEVRLHPSESLRHAAMSAVDQERGPHPLASFLWGFRILQVRRLLRHLSPSKVRSVGVGLVSIEGEVQPAQDGVLVHPGTEEACVYYAGADRTVPGHRFWLADDSGRVLVEPRGAVLLSEDGVLVPGERVRLIGTAQRSSRAGDDGKAPTVLRAGSARSSAFARIGQALLQSVMDRPTTRLLFSDPRRMLLIWDDAHAAPFASARETALVFLSFALAATWMLAFLAAVLVLVDSGFAAALWDLIA